MSVAKIGLVHPPPAASPSGGDLYNRQLLRCAAARGFPLHPVAWRDGTLPAGHWDLLVWDSLLLDRSVRVAAERVALLLHYLPSLDPTLEQGRRAASRAVEDRAVAGSDAVIATGKPVADAVVARWPGKPVFLCEPGVDKVFTAHRRQSSHSQRPHGPVQLLTVAHLLPAKGHRQLLGVLGQLRHSPWHWHVVGDGCRSPGTLRALRDLAAQLDLAGRITFHGAVEQAAVAALMAHGDLFVFPSTFESYGTALAEATAAGLPVLSNRVGAADRLVRHGVTGFLARPGDWDDFRAHLRILLEDAALRTRFSENLRDAAVRGWDETCADFRAACAAVLGA